MSSTAMPPNLRLVLEHLDAVRELDRYLRRKGVDRDLERFVKEVVCPAIQERVPQLKSWVCEPGESEVEWYPESWQLSALDESRLSVCVILPGPLSPLDDDPSVNIYVPKDWPAYHVFNDRGSPWVKTLLEDGFVLAVDNPDWDPEYAVGKYVGWLRPDGSFDESNLLDRIATEVARVVHLEPAITEAIRAASMPTSPKASTSQRKARKRPV